MELIALNFSEQLYDPIQLFGKAVKLVAVVRHLFEYHKIPLYLLTFLKKINRLDQII